MIPRRLRTSAGCDGCKIFLCRDGHGSGGPARTPRPAALESTSERTRARGCRSGSTTSTRCEQCTAEQLEITYPPTDEPWGAREMHVRHPDGTSSVSAERSARPADPSSPTAALRAALPFHLRAPSNFTLRPTGGPRRSSRRIPGRLRHRTRHNAGRGTHRAVTRPARHIRGHLCGDPRRPSSGDACIRDGASLPSVAVATLALDDEHEHRSGLLLPNEPSRPRPLDRGATRYRVGRIRAAAGTRRGARCPLLL